LEIPIQGSHKKANLGLFHDLIRTTATQKMLDKDLPALPVTIGRIQEDRGKDLQQGVP
jgi:hypothetical protein